jgi:dienelactone hydrolase
MGFRPTPSNERLATDVALRSRGRAVQFLCVALVGTVTLTACSGSDTTTAAPSATEADPQAMGSATPDRVPPATGTSPPPEAAIMVERADPATFAYDQRRPVDVEEIDSGGPLPAEMMRIQFPSQDGGMATGYIAPPADPVEDVGILWAHAMQSSEMNWPGVPWDGQDSFAPMAIFACAGATSIIVNAPYTRPTTLRPDGAVTSVAQPLTYSPTDRDEQIQLIRDMRRAIDVLQDRGAERIGFGGISYGATIGAALIGVDDRIEAAILSLGNSGLVERHIDENGDPTHHLDDLTDEEVETWVQAMLPIEPARFIGDSGAAILFLNGRNDPIIPTAEAERFHAAAPSGDVRWTNVGHDVSFEDLLFHNSWLGTNLGLDTERLDACTEELFPGGW